MLDGPGAKGHLSEIAPYLRDVADPLHRTDIEVGALDELLNSVLGAQQARVGTWQNDDMRRISAWAAIFAIPTMVVGVYGMNFEHMPELGWTYGYPLAVALMALASGSPPPRLPPQRLAVEVQDARAVCRDDFSGAPEWAYRCTRGSGPGRGFGMRRSGHTSRA
ncbi:CorA family divalent cation transporter [Streptomyces sp. NPDC056485]|uniref:CorA family divalent cation transporter n=1 Tax=unclassified Streptomyces TaxID=2593676 RepID=UPI0036830DBF